jgi:hypothetical protein
VTRNIVRKSTLALILAFLTLGVGRGFARQNTPAPQQPSFLSDIGGTDPDPTCGDGGCFVAIHST